MLRFEEILDAGAALRARDLLERAPQGERVVLDFTRVRSIDWFALATLAVAVAGQRKGHVELRGLCDQHTRLLRHLGLDVDSPTRRSASQRATDAAEMHPAAVADAALIREATA